MEDIKTQLEKIFETLKVESSDKTYFHESKKILSFTVNDPDGKSRQVKFSEPGITYKRTEPKVLSKKAQKRQNIKLKKLKKLRK